MSEDFDTQIEAKVSALEALKVRMEGARTAFVDASARFASTWYLSEAKAEIARSPRVTESLSDEQIAQLKREVQALSSNARDHVEEFLCEPDLWWHLRARPAQEWVANSYNMTDDRLPTVVDKAVRLGLGKLAPILQRHGYLKPTTLAGKATIPWTESGSTGNAHPVNERPYYRFSVRVPAEMQTTLNAYHELVTRGVDMTEQLRVLRRQKSEAHATKRWDDA